MLVVSRSDFSFGHRPACNRAKKLSSKHPAQSLDRKQKVGPCVDPAAVIRRQSAGGNQTVQMKMIFEGLVPGVQHGDDPKGSLKTSLAKLQQRFTDGFKQKTQANLFVGQDQPVKFMGQGKHQMEVPHRQKLRGLFLQPPGFGQRLAFGTVAVTAGVISRALKAARIAAIQMSAQLLVRQTETARITFCWDGR